ncbi:MAG TPA: CRTAC1 family protein, partial [Acidimicrobiales bacterium]
GRLDLYAVNTYAELEFRRWDAEGEVPSNHLYRNDGDGFTDISAGSGADLSVRGEGCVAADFDRDGATDLYVTTARGNSLLWGAGDGTFTEGAEAAGVDAYGWYSGAAVGDINGDGWPDLFVSGYVNVTAPIPGSTQGFPNSHRGVRDLLYLSEGPGPDGRVSFREVGEQLGVDPDAEYGLGALFTDVDRDHDLDVYVANDTNPSRLYLNEPATDGLRFSLDEVGTEAAVADAGSAMGVAGEDYDGDGRDDLYVTNLAGQAPALFLNQTGLGPPTYTSGGPTFGADLPNEVMTGWGTAFVDLDLDTDLDLLVANGQIPIVDLGLDAQPLGAYGNLTATGEPGRFEDIGTAIGLDDLGPLNARGLATADYDDDGDIDVAVSVVGARLVLLENRGADGHWLEVVTDEFSPGAVVSVRLADGRRFRRELHVGSSYLSSEDPRAHFGLGPATAVAEVRVRWPDGGSTVVEDVAVDQILTLGEEARS